MSSAEAPAAEGQAALRLVVVAARYAPEHRDRLAALFAPAETVFLRPGDRAGLEQRLPQADIAIIKDTPDRRFLQQPNLKWVHCNKSGLEECASPAFIDSGLSITSASGRSASVLAEHGLYFMLALAYNAPVFIRSQRRRVWGVRGGDQLRGLHGRRILVVGLGNTGKALVRRCQALEMQVTAFRRRPLGGEGLGIPVLCHERGDRVDSLLPDADIVALTASLNDTSHHMLDAPEFARMKRGALLVNVARAGLMNTAAFKAALGDGTLGGAGLDVTDPEPLPPWDSLWRHDNVLLTPHVTPRIADRESAEIDIIEDNFQRFLAGEALRNRLLPEDLYTRGTASQGRMSLRFIRFWSRRMGFAVRRL